MENIEFCRKASKFFTQKMSVHFLYCLFIWKGVKPTSMSKKICRNEISNPTSHQKKKKERKRGAKT